MSESQDENTRLKKRIDEGRLQKRAALEMRQIEDFGRICLDYGIMTDHELIEVLEQWRRDHA